MKKLVALATFCAFAAGGFGSVAFAADHPQQTRMKDCNVKAKGKKGDERRQYMSACLSGKDVAKDALKDSPAKKVSLQKKPQ
jgi:hypothetical protein